MKIKLQIEKKKKELHAGKIIVIMSRYLIQ